MGFRAHARAPVLALAFVLLEPSAAASPVAARIAQADHLIHTELRYDDAIPILERALADARIEPAERIDGYRLLGVAYVARGNVESAEAAFSALLEIDPGYELDSRLSPKIREVFQKAKDRTNPRILEVTAIPEDGAVVVSGRVLDPHDRLTAVEVFARAGTDLYASQPMKRDGDRVEAVVEVPTLARLRVDYYVVGRHEDDVVVSVGEREAPLAVFVDRAAVVTPVQTSPEPTDDAWYTTWWFWTITGAVVAGVVVGAILIPGGEHVPPGTLDPIRLD